VIVDLQMPTGTPIEKTNQIVAMIEDAVCSQPETKSISTVVGQRSNIETDTTEGSASHIAQSFIELKPVEQRDRESSAVVDSIRQQLAGKLQDIDRINFNELHGGPAGQGITIQVRGDDMARMSELVNTIKQALLEYKGVTEVADDNELGQQELQITLKSGAAALGFSTADVARQVRGALYGLDAHVFSANREDIDVRVRLDESTRHNLNAVTNLWLISPTGKPVPLSEIAEIEDGLTYTTIRRVDRKRTVTVSAANAPWLSPETVVVQLPIDQWRADYPDLDIRLAGRQEQQAEAFASLPYGFLSALVMMYVILAWLFSSYTQPLAVMLVIPFSLIGIIWGHLVLGYEMTFLSLLGYVALSGIVVNDSLILIEFYNRQRDKGLDISQSLIEAGRRRLRPIALTSVTTVLGLSPLMLEQSFQAKILIPMAISIAAGLMSATVLILLVLPCVIMIIDDVQRTAHFLWTGQPRPTDTAPEAQAV